MDLTIIPALTVAYEKTNDSFSGFGAELFFDLGSIDEYFSGHRNKFVITPYYRFYFTKSEDFGSKGFFAEVFSKFAFGESQSFLLNGLGIDTYETDNYFDIAPGFAVGNKWINRKGFTFELLFGLGRNLLYNNESEGSGRSTVVVRGGFSIGKRF